MASNQRRTDDLLRLKTRGLIYQNPDGSYPAADAVPFVTDASGTIGFSPVKINSGGDMIVPGDLIVKGETYQTVAGIILTGACPAISATPSMSLQPSGGNVGVGTCTPLATLDVSGSLHVIGMSNLDDTYINGDLNVVGTSSLDHTLINGNLDVSGGNIKMGSNTFSAILDISGTVNIDSYPNQSIVFPTSTTFVVPANVTELEYVVFGAGGFKFGGNGGTGAYIKGTINVTSFQGQTLTIHVGVFSDTGPSSSSYITIPNTGPLFVIAGAGGSCGSVGYNAGDGGAVFDTNGLAPGGNGTGAGSAGGGTAIGGASGSGGEAGNGRPTPETYLEALGGGSSGVLNPGGNGYTGGGAAGPPSPAAGGGGSSYYNNTYTTVLESYSGSTIPANLLPNKGRENQTGYVSLTWNTQSSSSLVTSDDIVCGGNLVLSGWTLSLNDQGQIIATNGAVTKTFTGV